MHSSAADAAMARNKARRYIPNDEKDGNIISAAAHQNEADRKRKTANWLATRASNASTREFDEATNGARKVVRRMR